MRQDERYGLSIRTQLLSVTALVCAGFMAVAGLTFFAFGHIQDLTRTAIRRDMSEMAEIARIGQRLSESFASVALLFTSFTQDEDSLREQGRLITESCQELLAENPPPELQTAIQGFTRSLDVLLTDLVQASAALRMASEAKSRAHLALDRLAGTASELAQTQGQGADTPGSPVAAANSLREDLDQADRLLGRTGLELFARAEPPDPPQRLAILNAIRERARPLAVHGPIMSKRVEDFAAALTTYENAVRVLSSSMSDLAVGIAGLKRSKDAAMATMAGLDEKNAQTTITVQNEIAGIITSTQRLVFISTAATVTLLLVVMGFFIKRIVNRPLRIILSRIEALRAGDLDSLVRLNRSDEWGRIEEALNTLARDLSSSYSALRESEKNYRDIFEKASEGIFQTTPLGRFYSANPAMARILKYDSAKDLLAQVKDIGTEIFVGRGDWEALAEGLLASGEVNGFEARMQRKDSQMIWVSINAHTILDASGDILYFEGTVTDVSARKRAERRLDVLIRHLKTAVVDRTKKLSVKANELEEANRRLLELDHMKSAFLSSVSHELRTPLTSILGFSKLIQKDFERSFLPRTEADHEAVRRAERIQHNLGIIAGEGERLTRLINDVLDLSRIESGRMVWNDQLLDPAATLAKAVDAVRGQFEQNPLVRLVVALPSDLPAIRMDPDRLIQVMLNLLHNAAKFTPSGEVSLSARHLPENGLIRVRVEDTGVGVASENLERIFDKFQQVKTGPTLADKPKGTGLGLAICRQIVTHYGGRIWAESSPGKGARITFDLPLSGPERPSGTNAADTEQPL